MNQGMLQTGRTMSSTPDPLNTYRQLHTERQREEATLSLMCNRLSNARLMTFLTTVVMAWGTFVGDWMVAWWLCAPTTIFVGLVIKHDRLLLDRDRIRRALSWYGHGIARLEDRWSGIGPRGDEYSNSEHPFSQDLDLFGDGSLFQLLNTTQTRSGEQTLASWLLTPANYNEVISRHGAVRDLQPKLTLREKIATAGIKRLDSGHPEDLVAWATAPTILKGRVFQILAGLFTLSTFGAIASWFTGATTALPMALALCLTASYHRWFQGQSEQIMHAATKPSNELTGIGRICHLFRQANYTSERLSSLRTTLDTQEDIGVDQLARQLEQILEQHDWQHNILFRPIAFLLFWKMHCAFSVETWRMRYGHAVSTWLRQIGEFEALSAIGTYAYEHPTDPFPKLAKSRDPVVYDAIGLAHPLLPASTAVKNDVTLGPETRVIIVSGSNMSGKTTLLRSVGVNMVMALMGAPVRAQHLHISSLDLGATLRIEDSLQAGKSRFYTEVIRLGQIVETARSKPMLVLLDELFHGTNSHDRTDGAHGLLRSLISLGAIGLVTTHDLALVQIGDQLAPHTCNMHFDDTMVDNKMYFDYKLKPGPVTRSNALAIMRAVGLDVSSSNQS